MVQFPLGHATAGSGGGGAGSVTVKSMWPARGSIVVVGPNPAPLPLTVSPVVNDLVIVRSPTMCAPGFCANAGEATSMDIRSARTVTVIRRIKVISSCRRGGPPPVSNWCQARSIDEDLVVCTVPGPVVAEARGEAMRAGNQALRAKKVPACRHGRSSLTSMQLSGGGGGGWTHRQAYA